MKELLFDVAGQLIESQYGLALLVAIGLNVLPSRYSRNITEVWSWIKAFVKVVKEKRKDIRNVKDDYVGDNSKEDSNA